MIAGIHKGIASRTVITGRSIGFRKDVVITGGAAKNAAVKGYLESAIGAEIILPIEAADRRRFRCRALGSRW